MEPRSDVGRRADALEVETARWGLFMPFRLFPRLFDWFFDWRDSSLCVYERVGECDPECVFDWGTRAEACTETGWVWDRRFDPFDREFDPREGEFDRDWDRALANVLLRPLLAMLLLLLLLRLLLLRARVLSLGE